MLGLGQFRRSRAISSSASARISGSSISAEVRQFGAHQRHFVRRGACLRHRLQLGIVAAGGTKSGPRACPKPAAPQLGEAGGNLGKGGRRDDRFILACTDFSKGMAQQPALPSNS
jgi:hypothetical protein